MTRALQIAFLGTGIMGLPMARNIAVAGAGGVRAWNRTAHRAEPLREHGVTVVADAADAVRGADVLVTMLADAPATLQVAREVLPLAGEHLVWWQAGTVGIDGDRRLSELAAAHGVAYVDGPVLGTRQPAEAGALTVLLAGPAAARETLVGLCDAVGARTVTLGDRAGDASRLKLVMNHWVVAVTAATADTILLARALGVDPERFLDTIAGGPLDAGYAQQKGRAMIAGDFEPPSFPLRHAAKDVRLMLEAAAAEELALALAPAILRRFEAAEAHGHGAADMAALVLGTWQTTDTKESNV